MRVPETLAEAKRLVKETRPDQMAELEPGYFGKAIQVEYGGITQRWLVVCSQTASKRELKTFEKGQGASSSCSAGAPGVPAGFQLSGGG